MSDVPQIIPAWAPVDRPELVHHAAFEARVHGATRCALVKLWVGVHSAESGYPMAPAAGGRWEWRVLHPTRGRVTIFTAADGDEDQVDDAVLIQIATEVAEKLARGEFVVGL